ncbi:plasmid stabilization protein, partial [Clostridioides difficile]|nr:plasmid stabilization protein [Clostridioides difficile]MCE0790047.1 plasmid stabilization protein [Clostridioides difficile]MCE0818382.1 plasmid stabilization protein [Clostridioides difficile]
MDEKILELLQEMQGSISGIEGTISDMQSNINGIEGTISDMQSN